MQQVTEEDGHNGLGVGPGWGRWGTSLEPPGVAKLHTVDLAKGLGQEAVWGPTSP